MRTLSIFGFIFKVFLGCIPFSTIAAQVNVNDIFVSSTKLRQEYPGYLCPREKADRKALIKEVVEYLEDTKATTEALQIWEIPSVISDLEQMAQRINLVQKKFNDIKKYDQLCEIDKVAKQEQAQLFSLLNEIDSVNREAQIWLSKRKQIHQERARNFNDRMHFRYGLSYFLDPRPHLFAWSLFNSGLFRLNSTFPNKGRRNNPLDEHGRAEVAMDVLLEADKYGYKAILLTTAGGHPQDISEFSFTDRLVPSLRRSFHLYSFNSTKRRNRISEGLRIWGSRTKSATNILSYQLFNEPFWTASPDPVFSYDPGTIGCSEAIWRQKIRERYSTFQEWKEAIPATTSRMRPKLGGKLFTDFIPWTSFENMSFGENAFSGLSFVDFLKTKHGDLPSLNRHWFGKDRSRYFNDWTSVFPPFPEREIIRSGIRQILEMRSGSDEEWENADIPLEWVNKNLALPKPASRDIPAWMDWTQYWAYAINDELLAFKKAMIEGGARAPVGSNTIGGHFINGFGNIAVDSGMNPWETPNGLGVLSIDFYSTAYLPYYIRALRGAAAGRQIHIHETELFNGARGAYALLFAFAHGADALSFWRKDEKIPPRYAIHLMKSIRAMADYDLQHHSKPVSDGIALVYSLDSLRLADARDGGHAYYLNNFQGAAMALEKMQLLFDISEASRLDETEAKVLVLPGVEALSDKDINTLYQRLNNGVKLIATRDIASQNTNGAKRQSAELARLLKNPNVRILDPDFFRNLRASVKGNDHDPNLLFGMNYSEELNTLARWLNGITPQKLRYLKPDGSIAPAHVGARQGESGTLFVFVDPWQRGISIEARGKYGEAVDVASGKQMKLLHNPNYTRIEGIQGPAVIRMTLTPG